jgi:predicted AlkP superfamily phosphohydrolase/phosphomutase
VAGEVKTLSELGLQSVEIEERSDTTAYHVPQGVLSIYDPQDLSAKSQERPDVSVLEIAPTVLSKFGVAAPAYMQEPVGLAARVSANDPLLSAR